MEPRLDSTCNPPPSASQMLGWPVCTSVSRSVIVFKSGIFFLCSLEAGFDWLYPWTLIYCLPPLFSLHWLACDGSAPSTVPPTWWWAAVITRASSKTLNLFIGNTRSTRWQRLQNGDFSSIFCVSVGQCLILSTCVITSILSTWRKLGSPGKKGAHLRKRLHEID